MTDPLPETLIPTGSTACGTAMKHRYQYRISSLFSISMSIAKSLKSVDAGITDDVEIYEYPSSGLKQSSPKALASFIASLKKGAQM
jgi:hypothetical protein